MKRPILYYALSFFSGCFIALLIKENNYIGAVVITASFILIIVLTIKNKFSIFCLVFFVIGILSYLNYFSFNIPKGKTKIDFRIIEYNSFYSIGSFNGMQIQVNGQFDKSYQGEIISSVGSFEKEQDLSKGIVATFNEEKIIRRNKDIITNLYSIKEELFTKLKSKLGNDRAAVIMALCFGDTSELSKTEKSEYQKLGVIHAISVSGFHMAVIFKLLEGLTGILPSVVLSFFYLIFTGSKSSTQRAYIMIIISKISKKLYKKYDQLSSLSLSALIILFLKPYYILDLGFILSYLATLGIILFYNKIYKFFYMLPKSINESLSLSLSAEALTFPVISFALRNFSSGFLLGNLLLLPIFTIIVILGNLALIFYKIDFIFNLLCSIINAVMTFQEFIQNLLISITPDIIYLTLYQAIFIILVYVIYILYKKGFKGIKYFPLILFILLLLNNYKFFVEIEYMDYNKIKMVGIRYKNVNFLLINGVVKGKEKLKEIQQKTGNINAYFTGEDTYYIKIDKDLSIKLYPSNQEEKERRVDFELINENYDYILLEGSDMPMTFSGKSEKKGTLKLNYVKNTSNIYDIITYRNILIIFNNIYRFEFIGEAK